MRKKLSSEYFISMAFSHMVYLDYEGIDTKNFVVTTHELKLSTPLKIVEHDSMLDGFNHMRKRISEDNAVMNGRADVYIEYKFDGGYMRVLTVHLNHNNLDVVVQIPNEITLDHNGTVRPSIKITPEKFTKMVNMNKLADKI